MKSIFACTLVLLAMALAGDATKLPKYYFSINSYNISTDIFLLFFTCY